MNEKVYGVCFSDHPLVVDGLWKYATARNYDDKVSGKNLNYREAAELASQWLQEHLVVTVHDHRNAMYPTIMADRKGVAFPACSSTDLHWSEYQHIKEELERALKAMQEALLLRESDS